MSAFLKLVTLSIAGACAAGVLAEANATCNAYGKVVQVATYSDGGTYVYVAPYSQNMIEYNTYFYVPLAQTAIRDVLIGSLHSGKGVTVTGDAASCTSGTFRWGGVTSYAESYQNY